MPTIVFDFLGTLVRYDDVINVIWQTWQTKGLTHHHEAVTLFTNWYQTSMLEYVAASHSGLYRSFTKVLGGTLARSIYKAIDTLPLDDDINKVMDTFQNNFLPAYDSLDALHLALDQGWNVWIITQGDEMQIWNYLNRYDLGEKNAKCDNNMVSSKLKRNHGGNNNSSTRMGPLFVMSCDELKVAKPHPKVYAEVMRATIRCTQKIENFYMVSSSSWDLEGAKNISMRTVFLANQELVYPTSLYDSKGPDLQGNSLVECVEKVFAFEQSLNLHYLS